jgi:hypothetical protein
MPLPLKLGRRCQSQQYSTIPVPIPAQTRVAAVSRSKLQLGKLRRLTLDRWTQIEAFRPNVLLGDIADLAQLANLSDAKVIDLSSVDTAILVTRTVSDSALSDVQRVVLWQAFAVPVYELLLSPDGRLIASECEAHTGWHLEPGMRGQPRLDSFQTIETALCDCGRQEPRIVIETQPRLVRALPATA